MRGKRIKVLMLSGLGLLLFGVSAWLLWPQPRDNFFLRFAQAQPLSLLAEIPYKERWLCHSTESWSDYSSGLRWAFAAPDGSLACLDNSNCYFINHTGQATLDPLDLQSSSFVLSFFPYAEGYCYCTQTELVRLDASGRQLWSRRLPDLPPYISLVNRWSMALPLPSGELLVINNWNLFHYDKDGKQLSSAEFAEELTLPWDMTIRPDGVILCVAPISADDYHLVLRAFSPQGQLLWQFAPPGGDRMRVIALADNACIVGLGGGRLIRFGPAGEQRWTIRLGKGRFDGRSFAVTPAGRIIVWSGQQLRYFGPNGKPFQRPLELGVKGEAFYARYDKYLSGADGCYYLQLVKTAQSPAGTKSNTILVLDAEGKALGRVELGDDRFELLTAGAKGELYGFRDGAILESTGWTRSSERDVVCLAKAP